MKDADLWAQVEAMALTAPDGRGLQAVLAADSALGKARAAQAVAEYRRWLYLQQVLGAAARPSPAMAAVAGWHRAGAPPAAPGHPWKDAEYPATLAAYEGAFGAAAPKVLWPTQAMLKRGQAVPLYFLGGMAGFAVAVFSGLWPVAIVAVLVAAVPAVIWNARGPWDATAKGDPTAQDNALGYDGGDRSE